MLPLCDSSSNKDTFATLGASPCRVHLSKRALQYILSLALKVPFDLGSKYLLARPVTTRFGSMVLWSHVASRYEGMKCSLAPVKL